jgi:hypothetical protein
LTTFDVVVHRVPLLSPNCFIFELAAWHRCPADRLGTIDCYHDEPKTIP